VLAIAEFIGQAGNAQDAAHWPVFAVARASLTPPRSGVAAADCIWPAIAGRLRE
jgi:hypothetical protein